MKRMFTLLGIGFISLFSQAQNALDFEASANQYIDAGTNIGAALTGTNTLTVEAWIKIESAGTFRTVVGNYSGSMQYLLRVSNGKLEFYVDNGVFNNCQSVSDIPLNTWTHVAGSWDGTNQKVFINGVLDHTISTGGSFGANNNTTTISSTLSSEDMDGVIDDVRIWSIGRTDNEIQERMNNCLTGSESGLLALYNFETGSGTTLVDITGNGNDGTFINSPIWVTGQGCSNICPSDMAVSITDSELCPTNTGTSITTGSSELGKYYYLRDNVNDTIVDGPIEGTGSGLSFNTGVLTNTMDYNVYALSPKNVTALTMDGVNEYVSTPNVVQDNSWTYETWVKPNDMSPDWSGIITSNSTAGSGMVFQLSLNSSGQLKWESFSPSLNINSIGSVINDDAWHHVAVTCDGTDITFYIDGIQVAQQAFTGGAINRPLHIMAERVPTHYITGQVDETMVWDYARTSSEILSDMTACLDGSEPGLLIYFDYEDGVGSTVTDLAGGDHNGTLMNMEGSDWTNYTDFINNCPECDLEMTDIVSVAVHDIEAPVADLASLTDVTATCSVTSITEPTATDNCASTITITNDATLPITTIGTTVVTWTYDDGNGNTSTQTQNVIINAPVIDVTTTNANFVITANNSTATDYQWIDCNNSNAAINGETNASYTALVNGDYAVIVTEGDCSDTSDCVTIAGVGINNNSQFSELVELYPNPNNGEFRISTTENNVSINIYSADGKMIINNLKVTGANQLINLGDIESGIYFVKITNNINQKTIRLIIE